MIILVLFPLFVLSDYFELTAATLAEHVGSARPVFVKFYMPDCTKCNAIAEDFDDCALAFPNVSFAGVDCAAHPSACSKYLVGTYPTLMIFRAGSTAPIEFDGMFSFTGFSEFVEDYTGYKAKRVPRPLLHITPLNLEPIVEENTCLLVLFYVKWCTHSKRFLPQARIAAASFVGEPNISIGTVDCEIYHELCSLHDITKFPTITLFKNDTIMPFNARKTAEGVVAFMNVNCGSEREVGGLLNDQAGLIEEAQALIPEFMSAEDRQSVVQKMSLIKGADFYVKVMQRYIAIGPEKIESDMATMRQILDAKQGSWQSLDAMKQRYNIFAQFLPKPPESPTPVPVADEGESIATGDDL
jgi:protein disulfide-isomerase A6